MVCGSAQDDIKHATTMCVPRSQHNLSGMLLWLQGLRVLGVATRTFAKPLVEITHHETDMCFQGFLAFLDPLKPTASKAIEDLNARSVEVKVGSGSP